MRESWNWYFDWLSLEPLTNQIWAGASGRLHNNHTSNSAHYLNPKSSPNPLTFRNPLADALVAGLLVEKKHMNRLVEVLWDEGCDWCKHTCPCSVCVQTYVIVSVSMYVSVLGDTCAFISLFYAWKMTLILRGHHSLGPSWSHPTSRADSTPCTPTLPRLVCTTSRHV